jgi:hypothetical protein
METAMRFIRYYPKITSARTVYVELESEDTAWLKTEMIRWLARMSETQNDPNDLWQVIHNQYWSKPTKTLPKGRNGLNSPASYVGGLINNLVFGEQRDFTQAQLEGIRDVSAQLAQLFEDVEAIQFSIGLK